MTTYVLAILNIVAGVYLLAAGLSSFRKSKRWLEINLSLLIAGLGIVVVFNGWRLWP